MMANSNSVPMTLKYTGMVIPPGGLHCPGEYNGKTGCF